MRSAVFEGLAWSKSRSEEIRLGDERVGLEAARNDLAAPLGDVALASGGAWLQLALTSRRPVSRLFAEVSNGCREGVFLEELTFANRTRLVIAGYVEGQTRTEALGRMAAFTRQLATLEFLHPARQEEVSEIASSNAKFRFRIGLMWRNDR